MKNIIISLGLGVILFLVSFDYGETKYPNEFYNVYLDNQLLGTINSSEQLYDYIDEKTEIFVGSDTDSVIREFCPITDEALKLMEDYKYEKYGDDCVRITIDDKQKIEEIYNPEGLYVEKVLTYTNKLDTVEEMYEKIIDVKPFSVKGYEFLIKDEDKSLIVNVLEKDVFENAINELIYTYVGENDYNVYLSEEQLEIETVGSKIENVYLEETITFKEVNIPADETIYVDSNTLASFLLFGDNPKTSTYNVKKNEMIADIAFVNEITINEFLISNPKYVDETALIAEGTLVQIKETNPQISVILEIFEVYDKVNTYQTVYQYDVNEYNDYEEKIQDGSDGMERISQRVRFANGDIVFVEPVGKEVLKAVVNEVIVKGEKEYPNVGYLDRWAWPTNSNWVLTSDYAWRIHPITGVRQFHGGIDIAGTGWNSPIYAANNGTVIVKEYGDIYGYYIVVDHNNGYFTLYSHMNGFIDGVDIGDTVRYGQQIGIVGSSGSSTGPHLHFEVRQGCWSYACHINPWTVY